MPGPDPLQPDAGDLVLSDRRGQVRPRVPDLAEVDLRIARLEDELEQLRISDRSAEIRLRKIEAVLGIDPRKPS